MTGYVTPPRFKSVGERPRLASCRDPDPQATRMDISHVFVPYKSQADGGPWALANCGPTSLNMILETFGVSMTPAEVRPKVLNAQGIFGNGTGTLLTALAKVAESNGLKALGLYEAKRSIAGQTMRFASICSRANGSSPRSTIAAFPGNEGVAYYADHYVVITGARRRIPLQRPDQSRRPRLGSGHQRRASPFRHRRQRRSLQVRGVRGGARVASIRLMES